MSPFPTAIAYVGDPVQLQREVTRTTLALLVIGLLSLLASFISIYVLVHGGDADTILTGVFAPVIGVAGTVLGFYFGSVDGGK